MNVAIIGAGKLGQAIAFLLRPKGVACSFWDADPAKVPDQKPLTEVVASADIVFVCVPSWAFRSALEGVLPHLRLQCGIVSFSKGIEEKSLKTPAELLSEIALGHPIAVIGGPMLADDILLGKAAVGVVGCPDTPFAIRLSELFTSPQFRVEILADAVSVSLAGVLKNVYAVSLGIADGLELGGNEKGWLVSKAINEMATMAVALDADQKIVLGTAGVGDLIATGYSSHSRNRQVGEEIVRTGLCELPSEGLRSLPYLISRLGPVAASFPLLQIVKAVGLDCQPAESVFSNFFNDKEE